MDDCLVTIDMGRKVRAAVPLLGKLGPHLTMSLGPRPTSIPSSILIHPAVWQQHTWTEKWGAAVPPFWRGEEELGPHLTQSGLWSYTLFLSFVSYYLILVLPTYSVAIHNLWH